MRPADLLVRLAMQFQADIHIIRDGELFDAKSMLSVMTLAAEQGTELLLRARGADANSAVEALVKLFERGFDEMEASTQSTQSVRDESENT